MLAIAGRTFYCGDFHTHWYFDLRNPSLFLAALSHWEVDFVVLQAQGVEWQADAFDRFSRDFGCGVRFFPGAELQYEKWHVALWRNDRPLRMRAGLSEIESLDALRPLTRLIAYAHPGPKDLPLVRELFQRGLIDAVQWPDPGKAEGAMEWYAECLRDGVRIPVVAGMDVHYLHAAYPSEKVFYQGDVHPSRHIVGHPMVTWVEADRCDAESLLAAVRAGRSVAMNMETQETFGPENLRAVFSSAGAAAQMAERRARRAEWRLEALDACATRLRAAGAPRLTRCHVPVSEGRFAERDVASGQEVRLPYPVLREESSAFQPALLEADGLRKVFAVRSSWPVVVQATPRVTRAGSAFACAVDVTLRNVTDDVLTGELVLRGALWPEEPRRAVPALTPGTELSMSVPVPMPAQPCVETPVRIEFIMRDGTVLRMEQEIAFAAALYCGGRSPWAEHEFTIAMDRPDRVMAPLGNYSGPADVSARVTLSWDESAFYLFAQVTDDVHHTASLPPAVLGNRDPGSEMFLNDSIEVGIDPLNLKDLSLGRVYNFNAGRDSTGTPRVIYFARPVLAPGPVTLGGWCRDCYPLKGSVEVDRDEAAKRTTYRLTMPWCDLEPLSPLARRPFGFSMLVGDNDGDVWSRKHVYWGGNTSDKKPRTWTSVPFVGPADVSGGGA